LSAVPEGGIAALNYAFVIYLLPVTIFSVPLITTMFSKFSKTSLDSAGLLRNNFSNALKMNAFLLIPLSFLLFFNGDFILYLFYEGGEFTSSDTTITHTALKYYTLSLFFYSSYLVTVKLFYSINKYSTVLKLSVAAFLLKVFFNFLFVDTFEQNGLALSTSLIYTLLFTSGFYLSIRKLGGKGGLLLLGSIMYFVLNGLFSYIIAYLMLVQIVANGNIFFLLHILIFVLLYAINSGFLKDDESLIIKRTVLDFFPRIKGAGN
jgi:putative peptidoglycan lipid II flippase